MRANLLHVFACYANPLRWRARLGNCRRFEHHILAGGLPFTTVECVYGRRDWDLPDRPGVRPVRVRARDLLWQKENLLGLAAQHTPDWEYAATIDCDIHIVDRTGRSIPCMRRNFITSYRFPASWYSSALPANTSGKSAVL